MDKGNWNPETPSLYIHGNNCPLEKNPMADLENQALNLLIRRHWAKRPDTFLIQLKHIFVLYANIIF